MHQYRYIVKYSLQMLMISHLNPMCVCVLTAVGLIRPVSTVVISVTVVNVQNTASVRTLELFNTTSGRHYIRCYRERERTGEGYIFNTHSLSHPNFSVINYKDSVWFWCNSTAFFPSPDPGTSTTVTHEASGRGPCKARGTTTAGLRASDVPDWNAISTHHR